MNTANRIVLIGAGRLASQLGHRWAEVLPGRVDQVFSRSRTKAGRLARVLQCNFTTRLDRIRTNAALYVIAVPDDVIGEVAATLSQRLPADALVVHTSGATPRTVLDPYFQRTGVFYPLQSFSENRPVYWSDLPILIDAAHQADRNLLLQHARRTGGRALVLDDQQRAVLHLGAVWVNNFANYCYQVAHHLLNEAGVPFDLLLPLMQETVAKLETLPPEAAQTGPAARGDRATLQRHLKLLTDHPLYADLYQQLSKAIEAGQARRES